MEDHWEQTWLLKSFGIRSRLKWLILSFVRSFLLQWRAKMETAESPCWFTGHSLIYQWILYKSTLQKAKRGCQLIMQNSSLLHLQNQWVIKNEKQELFRPKLFLNQTVDFVIFAAKISFLNRCVLLPMLLQTAPSGHSRNCSFQFPAWWELRTMQ